MEPLTDRFAEAALKLFREELKDLWYWELG